MKLLKSIFILFLSINTFSANLDLVSSGDDISATIFNNVINKVNCPSGLVQSSGFCIEPETTIAKGSLGTYANVRAFCRNKNLRMCNQNELHTAIDEGKLRTYNYTTEGDYRKERKAPCFCYGDG